MMIFVSVFLFLSYINEKLTILFDFKSEEFRVCHNAVSGRAVRRTPRSLRAAALDAPDPSVSSM